jgi:hypothetical protein
MAHVQSQTVTITVSKLVKDTLNNDTESFVTDDIASALESVVEELLNDKSLIVEVTTN